MNRTAHRLAGGLLATAMLGTGCGGGPMPMDAASAGGWGEARTPPAATAPEAHAVPAARDATPATAVTVSTAATAVTAAAQAGRSAAVVQPDPAAPVDLQARTASGRYISRADAERRDTEGPRPIWIDAGCCAGHDAGLPLRIVFGLQAVHGDDAPVFVHGADLRQAARLADRLGLQARLQVWLVTP